MVIVTKTLTDMLSRLGKVQKLDQQVLELDSDRRTDCLLKIEATIKNYGGYNPAPVLRAVENIFDHATAQDLGTAFIFDRFVCENGLVCRIWDAGEGFDFRGVQKSGDYGEGFKEYNEPGFEVSFEGLGNIINIFYQKAG